MSRTVAYLLADMHRAQSAGFASLDVQIADLKELLSRVEAAEARHKAEFCGKLFGYVTAHKSRKMLCGQANFVHVSRLPNEQFDTPVYFVGLPPKPTPEGANNV